MDTAHPLHSWLLSKFSKDGVAVDYEAAAHRCLKRGRKVSAKYLEQVARGYYSPHYKLGHFLSAKLTNGDVTTDEIMNFPYRRSLKTRAA